MYEIWIWKYDFAMCYTYQYVLSVCIISIFVKLKTQCMVYTDRLQLANPYLHAV